MLLAIDIGNSNTVVGVFTDDKLSGNFRVTSNHDMTVDECGFFITGLLEKLKLEPDRINRVVIASVVPRLTPVFEKMSERYLKISPLLISAEIDLPIIIQYDDPVMVGADRIANAAAAYNRFKQAIIVVDFGTTTNFDVINSKGIYVGGAIAPGPESSRVDLAKKAARLFEVNIDKPRGAIGKSTSESIKSGLFYGTIGQVDKIIELIMVELGENVKVIATGGLAGKFTEESKFIEQEIPDLTLEGLRIISEFHMK
jgi:type III pantothenate kinase